MRIDIATLFPEAFAPLGVGVIGRAVESGLLEVNIVNIRDYTLDKHGKCDDTPFGGGAGMVMTPQPIHDAISALDPDHEALRIYMSPKGRTLCQSMVKELAARDRLLFFMRKLRGDRRESARAGYRLRDFHRRLCAYGRRVARNGYSQRGGKICERRLGQRAINGRGELFRRLARVSAVHPSARVYG